MKKLFALVVVLYAVSSFSQVAINTNSALADGSAILDVSSINKGLLIPRLSVSERPNITNPATGLLIYQTDNTPGFYYNSGTAAAPNWMLLMTQITATTQAGIKWGFTTATPSSNAHANITVSPITQGNNNGSTTLLQNTVVSSGYVGASAGNNATASCNSGGFNSATSTYFQTTLTPTATTSVMLTNIAFGSWSSAVGPTVITVRTSNDNFASDKATFIASPNSAYAFFTARSLNVVNPAGTAITIRTYGLNASGGAGTANWRIDDLSLNANE